MNRERFEHLITVLDQVAKEKQAFDISYWAGTPPHLGLEVPHPCGTSACAFGYAALDPVFRAQGLNLVINMKREESRCDLFPETADDMFSLIEAKRLDGYVEFGASVIFTHPNGRAVEGMIAVGEFFEIGLNEARLIFDSPGYRTTRVTPEDVIEKIQGLLATGNIREPEDA